MVSPSSSPSEGEIVESDSDKATTAPASNKGTNVDRPSRNTASVSRSPSRSRSPRRHKSRTESRSPYRESRGAKRSLDDDHYDRTRNDPRRFKVRYEDYPAGERFRARDYHSEVGRSADRSHRHVDQDPIERMRDTRHRTRSRSPPHMKGIRQERERLTGQNRDGREDKDNRSRRGDRGYKESRSKLSIEQSVRDRGCSSVAAAQMMQDAESQNHQTQNVDDSSGRSNRDLAKYVLILLHSHFTNTQDSSTAPPAADSTGQVPSDTRPVDEATLIEERRKKREAIKAKHRGQATPMLVQALVLDSNSAPSTPRPEGKEEEHQIPGKRHTPTLDAY